MTHMKLWLAIGLVASSCALEDPTDDANSTESAIVLTLPSPIVILPPVLTPPLVAPGTYQIVHLGSGECFDVPGYSKSSGVQLQGYDCKHAGYEGNQQFTLETVTGGYRLRAFDSQLCAGLPGSATANGTAVQQLTCGSGQNQIWNLAAEAYGQVKLTAKLDATKCAYIDSAHVVRIAGCSTLSVPARSFAFGGSRTHYSIRISDPQCLDMANFTTATGASPQLFACKTDPNASNTTNQEWAFEPIGTGFRLRQQYASKCLDLRGGALADGTIVEQNTCTTGTSQQWRLLSQANNLWKLQNIATTSKCADFYGGSLRVYACSATYATQLYRLEPGLSGPTLAMTTGATLPIKRTGPSASYGVDPSLSAPTITSSNVLDNAITLEWSDPNPNPSTRRYYVFVWETDPNHPNGGPGPDEYTDLPIGRRAIWIGRSNGQPLKPGWIYTVHVMAVGNGVSPVAVFQTTLSSPGVTIGDGPNNLTWHPQASAAFAIFDANNDGIVNGAPAGAGAFPRYPSNSGPNPLAATGNQFASANGQRANVIVGYWLQEGAGTFVAHHMFINPATNTGRSIAVLYGDASGAVGTRVWISLEDSPGGLTVTDGNTATGTPNRVEGYVTAPGLAVDNTTRVIDFDFNLALEDG